jgi:hypothetical protein
MAPPVSPVGAICLREHPIYLHSATGPRSFNQLRNDSYSRLVIVRMTCSMKMLSRLVIWITLCWDSEPSPAHRRVNQAARNHH